MIEIVECAYRIFWLGLALGGAAFILAIIWSFYTETRRNEREKEEGDR